MPAATSLYRTPATGYGVFLREAARQSGITGKELAHRAGINRDTVGKVLAGSDHVRIRSIIAVADVLGLKLSITITE